VDRVGDRGLLPVEGVTGGGEPVFAAAIFGAAASAGTASAPKFGQALLDPGEPVVCWLARLPADRETGNSTELAPSRMEGLLALALETEGSPRAPGDRAGPAGSYPAHGGGEPALGSAGVQAELTRLGFKVSARTVAKYMRRPAGRAVGLASISPAARLDDLGLRFSLRPDDLVPDALRLFRHPPRQPGGSPCSGHPKYDLRTTCVESCSQKPRAQKRTT
jgi:hypothetical protein